MLAASFSYLSFILSQESFSFSTWQRRVIWVLSYFILSYSSSFSTLFRDYSNSFFSSSRSLSLNSLTVISLFIYSIDFVSNSLSASIFLVWSIWVFNCCSTSCLTAVVNLNLSATSSFSYNNCWTLSSRELTLDSDASNSSLAFLSESLSIFT